MSLMSAAQTLARTTQRINSSSSGQYDSLFSKLFSRSYYRVGHPVVVHKRGPDLIHDPWFNKSTAFDLTERDRLGLRGLLPPQVLTMQQQIDKFMADYHALEVRGVDSEVDPMAMQKWRMLNRLHDRNETCYYRILIDNITKMAPIIYTPTVGVVCQKYSTLFRRPRGMYISAKDKREMISMLHNWPSNNVDMIVVTDGSRILGLGDLGIQGIGIPIGKLDIYVGAAGFNPKRVLPIVFDVGTNNPDLINNPQYLGLRQPRIEGDEYLELIDEFMDSVFMRWPKVIVQHEDFQNKWAFSLLKRYRNRFRMFNDDVQGTAGVALAGLLNAVRAQGRSVDDIAKSKLVVVGAGSAGLGVVSTIRQAMSMKLGGGEKADVEAARNFWVLDKDGLLTQARSNPDPDAVDYARPADESHKDGGLKEGAGLLEVVKKVKPDILLGLAGAGKLFTPEVLKAVKDNGTPRPGIFPMSNPTSKAECTSEEAFKIIGSNVVFASGSPFPDIECADGNIGIANQGNNMYLYPGIGLGTLLSGSRFVTDSMIHAAANKLAMYISDDDVKTGKIFPPTDEIRTITRQVATAVLRTAVSEGNTEGYRQTSAETLAKMNEDESEEYVGKHMWYPDYSPIIFDNEARFHELYK